MSLLEMSVSAGQPAGGGPCAVVSLAGHADVGGSARFREVLELEAARAGGEIVVDLSRLSSIDWWAALILLWMGRVVRRRGGSFVLMSPQPPVRRLLHAAGAGEFLRQPATVALGPGTANPVVMPPGAHPVPR